MEQLLYSLTENSTTSVTLYGTKSDDGSDYSTRFKFDGFIEGEIDTSINILNDRFTKSLSVLPRGAEFRLKLSQIKEVTYDTSTKSSVEGLACMI